MEPQTKKPIQFDPEDSPSTRSAAEDIPTVNSSSRDKGVEGGERMSKKFDKLTQGLKQSLRLSSRDEPEIGSVKRVVQNEPILSTREVDMKYAHLCSSCRGRWFHILETVANDKSKTISVGKPNGDFEHFTYSPSATCDLCKIVVKHMFAQDTLTQVQIKRNAAIVTQVQYQGMLTAWNIQGFRLRYGDLVFIVNAAYPKSEILIWESNPLQHFSFETTKPLGQLTFQAPQIRQTLPFQNFGSSQSFDTVKLWLDDCTHHHVNCPDPKLNTRSPTRLINVGSTKKEPHLQITAPGIINKYAALSYCWGTDQSLKLTTKMLELDQVVFPLQKLPPTLKDAIEICRHLQIQYIWIDALCIVQDSADGEDWTRESGMMDKIFGNAFITIAASAAPSTEFGILGCPQPSTFDRCSLPPKFLEPFPAQGPKMNGITDVWAQFYPYDVDDRQPLASRAWAFQEYMLSPRVLSYQNDQLAWECNSRKRYSSGPISPNFLSQLRTSKPWQDTVQQYITRGLTFASDRLEALSGYARSTKFSKNDDDRYLAGIWSKGLPNQLLWYTTARQACPRPPDFRAPTWSWASTDGPIKYPSEDIIGSIDTKFEVLEAMVAVSELNPYGTLKASPPSYLRARGILKPIKGLNAPTSLCPVPDNKVFRRSVGRNWTIAFDVICAGSEGNDGQYHPDLWCLRITEFTALVLMRKPIPESGLEEGDDVFERVGMVRHWPREPWLWFDDVESATVVKIL